MAADWGISAAQVVLLATAAGSGIACGLLGLCSLVTYLLPPFVARLTPPEQLGGALGTLLAGQFAGVLLSRTVGGALAQLQSWRLVYLLAAPLMLAMAFAIHRALPRQLPEQRISYRALQVSQLQLWRTTPDLRLACPRQGLLFGTFLAIWSALALQLGTAPWSFGPGRIGLFGLVGLMSIALARPIGRLVDRNGARRVLRQAAAPAGARHGRPGCGSAGLLRGSPDPAALPQSSRTQPHAHLVGVQRLCGSGALLAAAERGVGALEWAGATGLGLVLTLLSLLLALPPRPRQGME
jgi:MFS family permease